MPSVPPAPSFGVASPPSHPLSTPPAPPTPPAAPMIPVPTLPPPVFAAPAGQPAHVPSEFTRILSSATPPAVPAVGATPPAAVPNAPSAQPALTRKPSYLPLVIALNVIVILAIALVAYFVVKK